MEFTQAGSYTNSATINDGVQIAAAGVILTNTESGRIVGGVRFLQGGGTVVNELGGIVRVADGVDPYTVAAVVGSDGADTFINNGLVTGLIQLGGGNDRYGKGEGATTSDRVDLGAGDDVLQRTGTNGWLSADGGSGYDRAELTVGQGVLYGTDLTGFE